ncbi:MAG: ABC transporter transmembrane domain-containing protein, partial [Chitinophagaceae bacterium]
MKIVKRLLPYARPLYHFLPEYVIYTTLGIGFGLLNFTLLIPVLQLLFDQQPPVLTHQPAFTFSLSYLKDLFNYWFSATIHEQGKFSALVGVCVIIASSILLANLFRYLAVRVLLRLRLKVMEGLRNHLYQKYLEQSLSFHYNHPKGELLLVMLTEVQEIESSIINTLQILLRDPFIVLAYFLILFYWSPTLTTFTLLFLPVTGITISLLTKKLKKMNYFSQEMQGKLMTFTDETLSGIKQVQSYVAGTFLFQTFRDINHELSRHSKRLFGKKELASPISEVLGVIAAVVLVIFGGYLILHQQTALTG